MKIIKIRKEGNQKRFIRRAVMSVTLIRLQLVGLCAWVVHIIVLVYILIVVTFFYGRIKVCDMDYPGTQIHHFQLYNKLTPNQIRIQITLLCRQVSTSLTAEVFFVSPFVNVRNFYH